MKVPDGCEIKGTIFVNCPQAFVGECVVPDGVTVIAQEAFWGCASLTGVQIPDSVTSIGSGAFKNCTALMSACIPPAVSILRFDCFENCVSLADVHIPDSVIKIGAWAFSGCKSLTSVHIPESVVDIGGDAFRNCNALKIAGVPDDCMIGLDAFPATCEIVSLHEYRRRLVMGLVAERAGDDVEIVGMHAPDAAREMRSPCENQVNR